MDQNRRYFNGLVSGVMFIIATNGYAQNAKTLPTPRENENDVIAQMGNAGYANFLLLNKQTSKLYIIQNSNFFLETPVIIGRSNAQKSLTPSGIFSLRNIFQGATVPKMIFHMNDTMAYALHGVVRGRESALMIDRVTARQLSDGCVNVPDFVLPYVLTFARKEASQNPQGKATPFVVMDERYNAKQFEKAVTTFRPYDYNPD